MTDRETERQRDKQRDRETERQANLFKQGPKIRPKNS